MISPKADKVTSLSVAKHAHHGPDFGLDLSKYGMNQADLDSIKRKGFISHINEGKKVPKAKFVKDLQEGWKFFAQYNDVIRLDDQIVTGKNCVVFKHTKSRIFVSLDTSTGESSTGSKLSRIQLIKLVSKEISPQPQ